MHITLLRGLGRILIAALLMITAVPGTGNSKMAPAAPAAGGNIPYFRYPVVPGATISGYFDHQTSSGLVMFFNGRHNSPGAGFYFNCSSPAMYDWVGCEDPVSGAEACADNRELWYDGHKGIDFEYSPNWNTGAFCDPARFSGITMPVYAPARGLVFMAGYDPYRPANGWHIRLKHDLNGNGNFDDDGFRSVYLHFTANALAVVPGQIVQEGQYLGLGGSTGYSSSPHLHFEVQRSNDGFASYYSTDPFGWQGQGNDPWPWTNLTLWKSPPLIYGNFVHLPVVAHAIPQCDFCFETLSNGGFEAGHSVWVEQGVQVITQYGDPNLNTVPYSGSWLAWMGGRNDGNDTITQAFFVPPGATAGRLRYSVLVNTAEPGGAQDYLYVRLRQPDDAVVQDLDMIDNTFTPQNQWVQREIDIPNLDAYAGQTLSLSFKAATDAANLTSFYLDEVSLMVNGQ